MLTVRQEQSRAMADANPGTRMIAPCDDTKTWIEIRLVDRESNPVPGERYRIRLPDSSLMEGVLDRDGMARVECIIPGQAQVSFPGLDGREWKAQ
jgi:type VI secretion system secreted protein VgrG